MKNIIYLNGTLVSNDYIKFSAGEVQLKLPNHIVQKNNRIEAHIRNSDGIMLLAQLAQIVNGNNNTLLLPYLPYSRYDRVANNHDALSLKIFCNMINDMNFSEVIIHDCHSDVGIALLNNVVNIEQHALVTNYILRLRDKLKLDTYDAIISPDAGASKKAFKLARYLNIPLIECGKHRDFDTGKILEFTVPEKQLTELNITSALMVDDIADGGGTFYGLFEALSPYIDNIDLYVTHGIFSKGTSDLLNVFNNIYMYHDWHQLDSKIHY